MVGRNTAASSSVTLDLMAYQLGEDDGLKISGQAEASFSPNWQLFFATQQIVKISSINFTLVGNGITLFLLTPQVPSMSSTPKAKRTQLTILRSGDNDSWNLKPVPESIDIGSFIIQNNLFDSVDIEAGEDDAGSSHIMMAQSSGFDKLVLQVGGGIKDLDGNVFTLSLSEPRYIVDLNHLKKC